MDPKKLIEKIINDNRQYLLDNEASIRSTVLNIRELNLNLNPEVSANIMLSIRHLEDARMRLGKALQYLGDGISINDKKNQS